MGLFGVKLHDSQWYSLWCAISSIKHCHWSGGYDLEQHLEEESEVVHKLGVVAPVHERYVEDESGEDEHHCVQVLDLGFLDDGRRH